MKMLKNELHNALNEVEHSESGINDLHYVNLLLSSLYYLYKVECYMGGEKPSHLTHEVKPKLTEY